MQSFLEHGVSSKKCLTHPECTQGKLFARESIYLGKVVPYSIHVFPLKKNQVGTLDRPHLNFSFPFSFLFLSFSFLFFLFFFSLPPILILVRSFHFIHASQLWGFDKCHGLSVKGEGGWRK